MGQLKEGAERPPLFTKRQSLVLVVSHAWMAFFLICEYFPKYAPDLYGQPWQKMPEMRTNLLWALGGEAFFGMLIVASSVVSWAKRPARLRHAPGTRLARISEFLVSSRVNREVLQPTLLDMRVEYNDALLEGRAHKARWVRCRGTCAYFQALTLYVFMNFGRHALKLWKLL